MCKPVSPSLHRGIMSNVVPIRPDMSEDDVPNFITPKSIATMSEEELDKLIEDIRLRRTNVALMVAEAQSASKRLSGTAVSAKIDKLATQLVNKLAAIDKHIDAVFDYNTKIRALRLQAGDL
jgi:outer membrane murein-binding lipoprotein Lpp